MKKRLIHRSKPSAFHALTSALIVLANSPSTQQAFALLALMTFVLSGVLGYE